MKTIYLMRHGQTDMNVKRCLQGQVDCPLNAVGEAQALEAKEKFETNGITFDHVYSSPLSRAARTAALATGRDASEINIDKRIIEQDFGPFEGEVYADFNDDMWAWLRDPEHVPTPDGMESVHSLVERTGDFINSFKDNDVDGNILVVTHGVAIRSILANTLKDRSKVWGMPIENCVLYKLELRDGEYTEPEKLELK